MPFFSDVKIGAAAWFAAGSILFLAASMARPRLP
jgi:hypothetical protein